MMSQKCDVCSMHFQDEYSLQGHLGGKRHLQKVQQLEAIERSIFISPLPKFISPHALIEFFKKYGAIKGHEINESYLFIEFADRTSTEAVLSNPVWIYNVKLNIKRRIFHRNPKNPETKKANSPIENTGAICYNNVKHIFEKDTTFHNHHLDKIFKVVFPKCKTYKFGSTQTGLGFKECDLDIYMDIGEPIIESTNASTNMWTMQKIFKEVRRIMFRMSCVFSNIISIPKAKTPIIKFCYVKKNISCDISFKNSLSIYKSNLIKYYISLDSRVKPLMMLIKYWARNFKISGSGKMSNYALVLLIIFYLQQPSVKIIPPLLELQKTCRPQIINGWQVNFDKNTKLPPITNNSSIPELLYGFFSFYTTFKYKSQIICPLDGKIHTELEFKDVDSLPPYMDRYKPCFTEDENFKLKINRDMCVQDPIELNHNVTGGTPFSTLDTFIQYCANGAAICTETSKNDYKNLLKLLLSTIVKRKAADNICKITISANQKTCIIFSKKPKLTNSDWYFTAFNMVKDIFEKVFKVQVAFLTADVESKQQRIDISDVHTEKYEKIILHCNGSHCVWRNRKIKGIILDPSISCLEKEALISDQVIENQEKEKSVNRINLDFVCTFEKNLNPLQIILTVSNQNTDENIFQQFAIFAKSKLVHIIQRAWTTKNVCIF
ncbi:speckle targeted PIP5K1A-regulated poly(A) polymerase isoform X2 [Nomia melanderi]|uniref:speckle targeted PIP5K1A-regulated poly(A) polymerase isoform X2 n=1 Tax=Nomia melanderi TaxID=2448451 RepID=UPI00130458E3|nr:speckle targeted PIP5K1A-regulated poly(A) polymerase-like isoform X2 [Nomia melanderi]